MTTDSKVLEELRNIFANAETFTRTKNYYFERHECGGETRQTHMDIAITDEPTRETIRIGFCPRCKTAFFTEGKQGK